MNLPGLPVPPQREGTSCQAYPIGTSPHLTRHVETSTPSQSGTTYLIQPAVGSRSSTAPSQTGERDDKPAEYVSSSLKHAPGTVRCHGPASNTLNEMSRTPAAEVSCPPATAGAAAKASIAAACTTRLRIMKIDLSRRCAL